MKKFILNQIKFITKNSISVDYPIFAYFISNTENYEEVIDLKEKFQSFGLEMTEEIYKLLLILSENYKDGKK
ncbi:hypothetical protein [Tepidibacillus sp. HK-1]|uniref:hypothetical protein n=1 Tax=Tepidibacillus sp. HK-1 TaxID=1883407 RepID=UPI000852DF04|nr:hypothetical protein [Tepidibacillus sp. HK-1]GBF12643.1 hypothetical protein HK1_02726 [Tepidibacillus sp. HK-1]